MKRGFIIAAARTSMRRRLLRELEADAAAIGAGLAVGRVVDLERQDGPAGTSMAVPGERRRGGARRDLRDEQASAHRVLRAGCADAGIRLRAPSPSPWSATSARRIPLPEDLRRPGRLRRAGVDEHVVHDLAIARPNLEGLNPLVFGEVGRHLEILIGNLALRGNRYPSPSSRRHRAAPMVQPCA